MYYEPQQLDRYLVRCLKRLDENDRKQAITILKKRMADLRSPEYHLTIPLEDLPLSTKAYNALLHMNLLNVKEVLVTGWDKLGAWSGTPYDCRDQDADGKDSPVKGRNKRDGRL